MSNYKLSQVNPQYGFKMDDYWVWCGSVIEDPDGNGYHMFASRWSKKYPMFEGYIFKSEIVRAWSKDMCGPYEYQETVLPTGNSADWNGRMAHNPAIVRYKDKFLLYYIASTYDIPVPTLEDIMNSGLRHEIYKNIRIGVLIADNPTGPWQAPEKPILEACPHSWDKMIVTNPAPCVLPDGRIFMYYRSNTPQGLRIGLAVANQPEGPYERISPEPVMQGINIEDPFVWHNGTCFEMIAKDMTGDITGEYHSGAHFTSNDGINWQVAKKPKAYSRKISFNDGSSKQLGSLERPQLLFDQTGLPKCLFAAAADGPGGFQKAFNTWNIAIPVTFGK